MDFVVIIRCFLVGMLASSSLGPIFILTFNRGAIYGFWRGFATALGASFADGLYFFLGLMGILTILKESRQFMFFLDLIGGILLLIFGIKALLNARRGVKFVFQTDTFGVLLTVTKSFALTILNPMVLFFFMVIGFQILPPTIETLTYKQMFAGSVMVVSGSLSVLSMVSLIASFLGSCISEKKLKTISFFTGLIFILVGLYFFAHVFMFFTKKQFLFKNLF